VKRPDRVRAPGPADLALLAVSYICARVEQYAVYSLPGVIILVGCVAILAGALLRGAARSRPAPLYLALAIAMSVWAQVAKPPWDNVVSDWLLAAGAWVAGAATLAVLATLVVPRRYRWPTAIGVLATLAAGYTLVVRGSVKALIDVWVILQGGSLGAAHGLNPYEMAFGQVPPGQVNDCFNYLPVTFLAPIPTRLAFGDVRYAEAAVLLAGVAALAWQARATLNRVALPLALLVGVLPGSLYEVQQAWNEALLVGALVGAAVLAERGHSWWAVGCVAGALATKQHVVLLVPLLAFWPQFGWRKALAAAAGGAALCLPWYAWDRPRFTHCTVDFFLDLPARSDSLSIWHWLPDGTGTPVLLAAALGAYALAVRVLPRDGAGLLLGWGAILGAWDLVNKQSFMNQWLLVAQLTVAGLALAATIRDEDTARSETRQTSAVSGGSLEA
jgi:hypothetical protein